MCDGLLTKVYRYYPTSCKRHTSALNSRTLHAQFRGGGDMRQSSRLRDICRVMSIRSYEQTSYLG